MKAEDTSQAVVAARMNLSAGALTNYLTKDRIPEVPQLAAIASHYKVSIDWLLTGEGSIYGPPAAEALIARDEYLDRMRSLPERDQRAVEAVIDTFAASSAAVSRAKATAAAAMRAARESGPKSSPSPEAAAPSVRKRARGSGTASHSAQPPVPPDQAPKQ